MFGDLGKMLALAQKVKKELPALKEKLAATEFPAEAGGGAVTAVVNGKMQIVDIRIAPELLADGDAEMLSDTVKAAIASAQADAAKAAEEAFAELTGGMNLPGMEGLMP